MSEKSVIEEAYSSKFPTSQRLYARAVECFPSGVTHDGRYLKPFPVYVDHAEGAHKWDVDGSEIIDYWVGHGALILGHRHPEVMRAVEEQLTRGTHLGACHELEIRWAELVKQLMPSVERVRFVSSGTEATMMALRLARAFTGRPKVLKFQGHFHGWNDHVAHGIFPDFAELTPCGVLSGITENVVIIPAGDADLLDRTLAEDPGIGQVIIEPTGGGFTDVPVRPDFHKPLREITRRRNVLLIYDEVITGFRVSPGGAQGFYGVQPDLTCMAKILAGGLPGGAVGGRADIMQRLALRDDADWNARQKMYHPGTYNANPVSASTGIATLSILRDGEACRKASAIADELRIGLNSAIDRRGLKWAFYGLHSGMSLTTDYEGPRFQAREFPQFDLQPETLKRKDAALFHKLRCALLVNGVDLPGKHSWISAEHTSQDVAATLLAFDKSLDMLEQDGVI